jgi:hypothetical protein
MGDKILDAKRTINGREGRIYTPGRRFIAWAESIDARTVIDRQDIIRSGARTTGYKAIGSTGTGTLNGFHVTSFWRRMISEFTTTGRMPDPCSLTMELADPDSFGGSVESCTLNDCNFWETPLGHDATAIVMDDFPFTFETVTWGSEIRDDETEPVQTVGQALYLPRLVVVP